MKKMTAILAVLIAAVMVTGMTASAEANSVGRSEYTAAMADYYVANSASVYGECYIIGKSTCEEVRKDAVIGDVYIINNTDLDKIHKDRTENIALKAYSTGEHDTVNHGSKENWKYYDYTYSVNTGVKY